MHPYIIFSVVALYFMVLMGMSLLTKGEGDDHAFFRGERQSPWYLVAFGMIGASLSGVTFISVPGLIGTQSFAYMQMVLGYLVGYMIIITVLMPLYYRLNLTSIYGYLDRRFGYYTHKTGAAFFILSRILGASFRLYLVASVFQLFVFDNFHISFEVTVIFTIVLIWLYTFKGGIKTIVWTDTLQTCFMLVSVILSIWLISKQVDIDLINLWNSIKQYGYSQFFFFDDFRGDKKHFVKMFVGGAFIALAMTGLDQDMMQKNLTCKTVKDAKKNMFWMSIILVFVNFIFLVLGALLYIFAHKQGMPIPAKADHIFPIIALNHQPIVVGVLFLLGLIAAAYSSADSALTSLTTSFCVDFLNFEDQSSPSRGAQSKRLMVHLAFSGIMALVIIGFHYINKDSVINDIFRIAMYTYGPLLGLYVFGLFTKRKINDWLSPFVCVLSVGLTFSLNLYSETLFDGFKVGFLLLPINGSITFVILLLISFFEPQKTVQKSKNNI